MKVVLFYIFFSLLSHGSDIFIAGEQVDVTDCQTYCKRKIFSRGSQTIIDFLSLSISAGVDINQVNIDSYNFSKLAIDNDDKVLYKKLYRLGYLKVESYIALETYSNEKKLKTKNLKMGDSEKLQTLKRIKFDRSIPNVIGELVEQLYFNKSAKLSYSERVDLKKIVEDIFLAKVVSENIMADILERNFFEHKERTNEIVSVLPRPYKEKVVCSFINKEIRTDVVKYNGNEFLYVKKEQIENLINEDYAQMMEDYSSFLHFYCRDQDQTVEQIIEKYVRSRMNSLSIKDDVKVFKRKDDVCISCRYKSFNEQFSEFTISKGKVVVKVLLSSSEKCSTNDIQSFKEYRMPYHRRRIFSFTSGKGKYIFRERYGRYCNIGIFAEVADE